MTDVRSTWFTRALTIAGLGVIGACTEAAPAQPTFQADVLPILAANCVRCHAVPAIGGAPGDGACTTPASGPRTCGFRLDSYDDVVIFEGDPATTDDDVKVLGAGAIALAIPFRVDSTTAPMPPVAPLGDVERATLVAWAAGDPPDRTARPGNRAPTITTEVTPGAIATIAYHLDDADGDLTMGVLRAVGPGGDLLVAPIQAGRATVQFAAPAAGSYALVARVDDGGGWIDLPAGAVEVTP
ncbi:MAG: hypothetical protein R3B06_28645 [Kofleriaceae bacterium]